MNILFVLIPLSLALVGLAVWGFFWAVGNGQFDNLESAGWDALVMENESPPDALRAAKSHPNE